MISLNELIISALMISGTFIFVQTAAASIIFALLAASPERAGVFTALRLQAKLRDLRTYLARRHDGLEGETINLLIYEHPVRLSRNENWQRVQTLLRDRDEIYHQMTDQL